MKIEKITSFDQIYSVMSICSSNFFDQKLNNPADIKRLAEKFTQYASVAVAYEVNEIAGFVAYYSNDLQTKIGFISMIVVKKEFAGKGIGTTLLEHVCCDSARKGMERIDLEVDIKNINAIEFYLKRGFHKKAKKTETSLYFEREI